MHHKWTKHVNIAYYYTRQIVNDDVMILMRINTRDQVADLMIKPLARTPFEKLHALLKLKATNLVVSAKVWKFELEILAFKRPGRVKSCAEKSKMLKSKEWMSFCD